jgi:uncharacterized protein involved in outer membrane biogenesis
VEVEGLTVANPPGFAADAPPLARIERLGVTLDAPAWLRDRTVGLMEINVIRPVIEARALPDGTNNWTFPTLTDTGQQTAGGSSPVLGTLRIEGGRLHAQDPKLKADFALDVATIDPPADTAPADRQKQSRLRVTAKGTYAGHPITGRFEGGALLAVRRKETPYPVDLHVENGPTQVDLTGTLLDPAAFGGADLRLDLRGRTLAALTPLTGLPLPDTQPFRLTGRLDLAGRTLRFTDIDGRLGHSDIGGEIVVGPGHDRPEVHAKLASQRVDLEDLGGLIGASPNAPAPPPNARLLPNTPVSLPALRFADVDLTYRGKRIEGSHMPFDDIAFDLTLKDGVVRLQPLRLGVGHGGIEVSARLEPLEHVLHARADIAFRQVDLARLMAATKTFGGGGTIGGRAVVEGTGASVAGILGTGDGDMKLFMTGGDISALLVHLSDLAFANALLSALGVPERTRIRCMLGDFVLRRGLMTTRTFVLDTEAANVTGHGSVNLRDETLDLTLNTEAKHFTIGSLPGPILVGGHLRSPSVRPGAETAARAGAAAGLGVLLTPLGALLPTIQLGLGEDNDCGAMIRNAPGRRR